MIFMHNKFVVTIPKEHQLWMHAVSRRNDVLRFLRSKDLRDVIVDIRGNTACIICDNDSIGLLVLDVMDEVELILKGCGKDQTENII